MTTNSQTASRFCLRYDAGAGDVDKVREIATETRFFAPHEVDIAVELVAERLTRGTASGYEFIFADREDELAGYVCYGEIPCTVGSFDVYWIVVSPRHQRSGLGSSLMSLCEEQIAAAGGRQIYVETSGREQYQSTRDFYLRCGYQVAAELQDFYALGDAKVIFQKRLAQPA